VSAAWERGRARELRWVALPLGLSVACLLAAALAAVARARYGVAGEETRLTWALAVLLATAVLAAAAPGWLVVLWRGRRGAPAPHPAPGAVRRAWYRLAGAPLAIRVIGLVALALVASVPAASFRNYVRELEYPSLGPLWPLAAGVASASVAAAVLWLLLLSAAVVAAGALPTLGRTVAFTRWLDPATRRIRERAAALAPPAWATHVLALGAVVAIGWLAFAPILGTPPIDYDNLFELSATLGSPQSIYPGTPAAFFTMLSAGYRPLPYFSMWAQYQLTGVASTPLFLFNIVAATLCGVATYLLGHRLTRSVVLALGAALVLLVDIRVSSSITQIVTRTQTMACLFGLGALILAYRGRPRGGPVLAGVAVLLFAALLCKEYAAAAVAAVFVLGLLRRGEGGLRLTGAAVGAFALYTAIRIAIDPGAGGIEGYCETLGYFFESREACYGRATVSNAIVLTGRDQLYQHLYNVVGGFVAILLPVFFEGDGSITPYSGLPDTWRVAAGLTIFALALVGWIARPRQTLPLLAMVAGNALTMFLLYRTRNVLLGAAGVYLSAAVGLNFLLAWSREKAAARSLDVLRPGVGVLRAAGVLVVLALTVAVLVDGVEDERSALEDYRASVPARFPCEAPRPDGEVSDPDRLYFDPEIVRAARAYYGQEPGCGEGP
jgi:hypothetical protein